MPRRTALVAFLGPSLSAREARSIAPGCLVLPPARQGDVWRALALRHERSRNDVLADLGVLEDGPALPLRAGARDHERAQRGLQQLHPG